MCGIAAILFPDAPDPGGAIDRMVARLGHRGPDARQTVRLPGIHLGHTRLSIIDLGGGGQPMADETGRFWLVFNGEIFNYRELRRELEGCGWVFRTESDTEVLLRACQQFGDGAPERLNGQFAFLFWDAQERRLFGARDRLGEKPLFHAAAPGGHRLFASELKGLLAAGLVQPRIDRVSVDAYLGLLYVPPDRSIYEQIRPIRPGHAFVLERGTLREWAYWRPRFSTAGVGDAEEVVAELRTRLSRAVKRQMVADVPVGAFLSGGLDSTTVVALMTRETLKPVATFSVGFGDLINELPYARAVAAQYRTDHHEVQMDIPVGELLERMAGVYDEPFADSSNIPTYLISEFARREVKVVLSGDGADELFGGYEWYRVLLEDRPADAGVVERLLLGARWLGWRLRTRLGVGDPGRAQAALAAWYGSRLRHRHPDLWDRHLAHATGLVSARRAAWWGGRSDPRALAAMDVAYRPGEGVAGLDRATDFDVRCYLPGDILVKVDRASMAHSLETRAPFLDFELVDFVLGLPTRLRFGNRELKPLLRASCSDLWPESLRGRGKQGFGAPIEHWLRRPDVVELAGRLRDPGHPLAALLPGLRDAGTLTAQERWTLLCLALWLEQHTECLKAL